MYPLAYASAQRTLRVWGVIGIVVFGSLGVFVGSSVLSGSARPSALHSYLVNFTVDNGTQPGGTGSAPYLKTTTLTIPIKGENLTNVSFSIMWSDGSISPLTNPAVSATVTGPNGTGSTMGRIATQGTKLSVAIPNSVPANGTVQAATEADAVAKATGDNANATLGSGEWTVDLQVGAALGGRLRPGGSISYTISVEIEFFVGSAKQA